jgi:septum formation topological specificity factor MinE
MKKFEEYTLEELYKVISKYLKIEKDKFYQLSIDKIKKIFDSLSKISKIIDNSIK